MDTQRTLGFTILETMLFLAITGLLIVTALTGVGTSLSTQRYRDSVQSLKSLIQDQYTQVQNVVNDHDNTWICSTTATVSRGSNNTGTPRGQSDCVVLGRYIVINKTDVTVETVVGNQVANTTTGTDVQLLKANYAISLDKSSTINSTLEWNTKISWPVSGTNSQPSGTPRSIGILIVQSPDSGIVYTFTVDSPSAIDETTGPELMGLMVPGSNVAQSVGDSIARGQSQRTVCVDPSGYLTFGGMAIVLDAYASNSTAVETQTNEMLQSNTGNGGQQC